MIPIFYEDQRAVRTKGFGPHELAVACAFDDADGDGWKLRKHFFPVPKKGVSNVLKACNEELPRFAPQGGPVVVVLDDDQIRRELALPAGASRSDVLAAIKQMAPYDELAVFLLEENTESLVNAVRACAGDSILARKPNPEERDVELTRATWAPARTLRDCVRAKVPSFDALVRRLVELAPRL